MTVWPMGGIPAPVPGSEPERIATPVTRPAVARSRTAIAVTERSCCCAGPPTYRVLIPASAARPHATDLLLCGHHYRASRAELTRTSAAVFDADGALIAG